MIHRFPESVTPRLRDFGIRAAAELPKLGVGCRSGGRRGTGRTLGRLFFAFPSGFPGIALLILRLVLGLAVGLRGVCYLQVPDPQPVSWALGLFGIVAAALLILGFLTPFAGALVLVQGLAIRISWLPECSGKAAESSIGLLFRLAVPLAIVGLGPGAFSLDARKFGRREIIIPPGSRSGSRPV